MAITAVNTAIIGTTPTAPAASSSQQDIAASKATAMWSEAIIEQNDGSTAAKMGMMYSGSATLSKHAKDKADELHTLLSNSNLQVDNPVVLAQITSLSANYNMARQIQSTVMKGIKDTAQSIIRNM